MLPAISNKLLFIYGRRYRGTGETTVVSIEFPISFADTNYCFVGSVMSNTAGNVSGTQVIVDSMTVSGCNINQQNLTVGTERCACYMFFGKSN